MSDVLIHGYDMVGTYFGDGVERDAHGGQCDGAVNKSLGGKCPTHFTHLFMFQFSPTPSVNSPRHNPPPRTDSFHHDGELTGLQDELRDFRRVHDQGQEEDLRMALSRTITKVEELVRHYTSNRLSLMARISLTQNNESTLTVCCSD